MSLKNWAGNIDFSARQWAVPTSIEALQETVARAQKVRAAGTRHSFNRIADCDQTMVSLENFNRVVSLDREKQTVTLEAGIRYGELCHYLAGEGFAIHNLASLVHIGVMGACATATHGSGLKNGNLATAVAALEIVGPDGEITRHERGDASFNGLVVGLGAAGVVTRLTLDVQPTFQVQQFLYEDLPFSSIDSHFEQLMGSAYSVSFFTDWSGETINQVWLKHRMAPGEPREFPGDLFGARPAIEKLHPIPAAGAENCTDQLGVPGEWHDRLQHFRFEFTPSFGDELQSEFLLPIENAVDALYAVKTLGEEISPLLYTSEIRTVAEDELWMSMNYHQPSVAIHFTWKPNWPAVQQKLEKIEAALMPYGARPHWGKLFTLPKAYVQSQYTKLPEFRALLQQHDPNGKFRNAFVEQWVW